MPDYGFWAWYFSAVYRGPFVNGEILMKNNLRRMQVIYTVLSCVIIIAVSLFISLFVISQTDSSMKRQVSNLIAADAHQLELNIDSYLNEVEKITTLLFSDEAYYGYDATDPSLSEYDKIQAAEVIREKIVDLGLIINFSDFAIVYYNDETVGWVSQVTKANFAEGGMYDEFSALVRGNRKEQGWTYGVKGNYDRLYYAKRLNTHAIVFVSFYGNELENAFVIPDELSDMTIRLISGDNTILYSSDSSEISKTLPEELAAMLGDQTDISVMDDNYLVTSNHIYNGWEVVCSMPTDTVLADSNRVRRYARNIVVVIAAVALIIMLAINRHMNRSMSGMVENLSDKAEEDQMTGLLNKTAFMTAAEERIKDAGKDGALCFIMFDLDNFKQVNDTLGHSTGDKVIILMSRIMKTHLTGEEIVLGRVGGDEFAAFAAYPDHTREEMEERIYPMAEDVIESFKKEVVSLTGDLPLSASAGLLLTQPGEFTANDLYQRADAALYVSKRSGKAKVTVI